MYKDGYTTVKDTRFGEKSALYVMKFGILRFTLELIRVSLKRMMFTVCVDEKTSSSLTFFAISFEFQ